jgi:2'-hydroxyisoflavone reductase
MHVLVLGGSGFIGRHTVSALLAAGHRVSALQRGDGTGLPAGAQRLQGDRQEALPALARGRWDACVDVCGYFPRSVRASCAALAGVRRYVYVSAVRVYGDPPAGPVTEDFPRLPPAPDDLFETDDVDAIDDAGYGPLKVACEDAVRAAFGDRATLLRPQVVAGPGDPSGRVAHWQARPDGPFPGDGSDWLQMVDVRDVARFIATVIDGDLGGAFNLAGPRMRWRDFVAALGVVRPRWTPVPRPDFRTTPLYRPAGTRHAALMDVSSARAQAAGFRPRPAHETVRAASRDRG